jgi:hypothetical protein
LTIPIEHCNKTVASLEKAKARFTGGGVFNDVVHAKQYADGVFAYFIVRTDVRTERESLFADAYMLQEEDKLGLNLTAGFPVDEDLAKLGYSRALERRVEEWRFTHATIRAAVFDVQGFGKFLEIALPATKIEKAREASEKIAFTLIAKLGLHKEDVIPTDVITLQMLSTQQAPRGAREAGEAREAQGAREARGVSRSKKFGGDFKLGSLESS